jgi:hypothetical protein
MSPHNTSRGWRNGWRGSSETHGTARRDPRDRAPSPTGPLADPPGSGTRRQSTSISCCWWLERPGHHTPHVTTRACMPLAHQSCVRRFTGQRLCKGVHRSEMCKRVHRSEMWEGNEELVPLGRRKGPPARRRTQAEESEDEKQTLGLTD